MIADPLTTNGAARAFVVLFDGLCPFCRAQAKRLAGWSTAAHPIEVRDFQAPGALDAFPSLTHAACMQAMQVVAPSGAIYAGAEAIARVLLTRWWGAFAWGYYLPGVRQIADALYRAVAKRRYRLARRVVHCDGTTCSAHFE